MRRHLSVFVGSHADLWPLLPVIDRATVDDRFEVTAVVSAADVRLEGVIADLPASVRLVRVGRVADGTDAVALTESDAALLGDLTSYIGGASIDLLLCLGDRHELLAVALASLLHGVSIAHLHGGEITTGAIDDSIRHAMSKLAHVHLVATAEAARRLEQMGEEPWRIHETGAPGLDRIVATRDRRAGGVDRVVGQGAPRPIALLTFHPSTTTEDGDEHLLGPLLSALDEIPTVIATLPGLDVGADRLGTAVREWAGTRSGVHLVESLGSDYADVLVDVDLVVGNSSSGIIEAPTAGIPVVDVGHRQEGRERSTVVLPASTGPSLSAAIRTALSADHRELAASASNPYGDGQSAQRAVDVLAAVDLDRLVPKRWVDLDEGAR